MKMNWKIEDFTVTPRCYLLFLTVLVSATYIVCGFLAHGDRDIPPDPKMKELIEERKADGIRTSSDIHK